MIAPFFKSVPVLTCSLVIAFVSLLHITVRVLDGLPLLQRLEWITYDWRMRQVSKTAGDCATNLGFVAISDDSIEAVLDGMYGTLPYQFGLYWPRQVYARVVDELAAQGAVAVGFDVVFGDLRPDHPTVQVNESQMSSDHFFARRMQAAGNVVLAADRGLLPHELFRTNAWAVADISANREADGILRRARAYEDLFLWHPLINDAARLLGWDLRRAERQSDHIDIPVADGSIRRLALDEEERFDQVALFNELTGRSPPANVPTRSRAVGIVRSWQMGIVLAARQLGFDLQHARVVPGAIVLTNAQGLARAIPVDSRQRLLIDWRLTPFDSRLTKENIESLLLQHEARTAGNTAAVTNRWQGKLAVLGSTATGNDLTDLGATPLEKETFLLSQHWNIANSVLTGRFIERSPIAVDLLCLIGLGILAGVITWNSRAVTGALAVVLMSVAFVALCLWSFTHYRLWLPMVLPVGGALLLTHVSLVSFRAMTEQKEKRRVKDIFAKLVAPEIVHELLDAKSLPLGGLPRRLTVFFADIRGFTEMLETNQKRAQEHVRCHGLQGSEAELYLAAEAQEAVRTVNQYLALVVEQVMRHGGTLDKYIGDCVMAFWGAPTHNPKHALSCVRAVMAAQHAIDALNRERAAENQRRERENAERQARSEPPLPLLTQLTMGSGINTGMAIVGLMGPEKHLRNYTVFGREVNLASRLEAVSGHGRIVIGEGTFADLERDDPALAATCRLLPSVALKGFQAGIKMYEVPWRVSAATSA